MICGMRVVSVPRTVACADKIMQHVIDTNHSGRVRDLVKYGAGIDPLKKFSEAESPPSRISTNALLFTRHMHAFRRTICLGTNLYDSGKENYMGHDKCEGCSPK
jgi:hypothetical protein